MRFVGIVGVFLVGLVTACGDGTGTKSTSGGGGGDSSSGGLTTSGGSTSGGSTSGGSTTSGATSGTTSGGSMTHPICSEYASTYCNCFASLLDK
jgi:hypothetical protein